MKLHSPKRRVEFYNEGKQKLQKVIKNRKKVLTGDKSCDIISELRPGRTKQEP